MTLIAEIDAVGIFVHNVSLSLPMFIPGFGVAWGAFAAFSTGMAFSVIKDASPMLANVPSLTVLFMSPFGLMEVAAYSIAMSRSYMIVHKMIKRMPIRPDYRVIGLEIAILIGLLLTGGFVEYYFIESLSLQTCQKFRLFYQLCGVPVQVMETLSVQLILKPSSSLVIILMLDEPYLFREIMIFRPPFEVLPFGNQLS